MGFSSEMLLNSVGLEVKDAFSGNNGVTKDYLTVKRGIWLANDGASDVDLMVINSDIPETLVDEDSVDGQNVLKVSQTTCFQVGDKIIIGRGTAREEEQIIAIITAGVSLTLIGNLTNPHTALQADTVEKYISITTKAGDLPFEGIMGNFKTIRITAVDDYRCVVKGR